MPRVIPETLSKSKAFIRVPPFCGTRSLRATWFKKETFGPLLVVQKARSFQHGLALANGVRHGLVLSLFSSDPALHKEFPGRGPGRYPQAESSDSRSSAGRAVRGMERDRTGSTGARSG